MAEYSYDNVEASPNTLYVTGIENWDMHAGGGPLAEPMIM
jgi:hypothetical protein